MVKNIYIIIVTYKGRRWYDRCFVSLRNSNIPVKTIVIDNASNDGSVEYIREHYPEVILIESKENLGFGRANNIGMRYALDHECDYVFLLNQDAWIEPDTIVRLVEIHQEHPDFGIISPIHLVKDKNHLNILIDDGQANYELLSDCYCNTIKDIYHVKYVNAAAWLLPRNTIETVGGFDPIYKHYEEDDDYLNRAIYHHVPIVLCPKVRVVHDHTTLQNEFVQARERHQQFILLEHTNINKKEHVDASLCYLVRKMIVCICRGKKSRYQQYKEDFCFLRRMKSRILQSRANNMEIKPNWL